MGIWTEEGFNALLRILHACKSIRELDLTDVSRERVHELATFPSVQKLAVRLHDWSDLPLSNFSAFAEICERRPDMEFLKIGAYQVSRNETTTLYLAFGHADVRYLPKVLNSCKPLHAITISRGSNIRTAELLSATFRGQLTSLTCYNLDGGSIETLLTNFGPMLKQLDLGMRLSKRPFSLIVATCPQLVVLALRHYDLIIRSGFDEDDTIAVIRGYPKLKEHTLLFANCLTLTRRTLQTVLDCKLRLRLLKLVESCLSDADAKWFCEQAKDRGLLPVPIAYFR